jgi:hypothetical protein
MPFSQEITHMDSIRIPYGFRVEKPQPFQSLGPLPPPVAKFAP